VRDASLWESEGVCVSRASFASPVPPTEGVQRGGAPRMCAQVPSPKSQEGAGTRPCRGFGGVPQSPSLPPRMGARGLKARMETVAGFAPLYPPYDSHHRGGQSQWCPYEFLAGMCRGAEPLECAPKSQIQNPKRVQGTRPCRGLGCPQILQSPPKNGGPGG
jgi:hypothetical protein